MKLPGLNPRTAPELLATVSRIAPDATQHPVTGETYYAARIVIPSTQRSRLSPSTVLSPGMPVEAYFKTEDRTVLSYLLHPFADQLSRALRED